MSLKLKFPSSVKKFHSWLQINFPFIQLLVPHLELPFKEVVSQFISPSVSKQLRPQMLDLRFLKVCLQNKLLIISNSYFRILQPKSGSLCSIFPTSLCSAALSLTASTQHQNVRINVHIQKQSHSASG